jgi:hypothetical protein
LLVFVAADIGRRSPRKLLRAVVGRLLEVVREAPVLPI